MERLGIGRRNDAVTITPDDVGGDVHPMQPALQPRIEEARLPPETRAGNAVIDPGRRLGGAKPRVIGHDHIEPLRQRVEDRRPVREPIGAVQVYQRYTLAAARKAELAAVDLDRLPDELHGPTTVPMRSFAKR